MKEPDYIMEIMSTYGSLVVKGNDNKIKYRNIDGKNFSFYQEPFANHFKYCHTVDNHNSLRHSQPCKEKSLVTHSSSLQVFSFLLAISEINCNQVLRYFVWESRTVLKVTTLHNFRKKLVKVLIHNEWIELV